MSEEQELKQEIKELREKLGRALERLDRLEKLGQCNVIYKFHAPKWPRYIYPPQWEPWRLGTC